MSVRMADLENIVDRLTNTVQQFENQLREVISSREMNESYSVGGSSNSDSGASINDDCNSDGSEMGEWKDVDDSDDMDESDDEPDEPDLRRCLQQEVERQAVVQDVWVLLRGLNVFEEGNVPTTPSTTSNLSQHRFDEDWLRENQRTVIVVDTTTEVVMCAAWMWGGHTTRPRPHPIRTNGTPHCYASQLTTPLVKPFNTFNFDGACEWEKKHGRHAFCETCTMPSCMLASALPEMKTTND